MSETMDSDIERIAKVLCHHRVVLNARSEQVPRDEAFLQRAIEAGWGNFTSEATALLPLIAQAKEEGAAEMRERAAGVLAKEAKRARSKLREARKAKDDECIELASFMASEYADFEAKVRSLPLPSPPSIKEG